jgi:hypothetical protein
MNKRDLAELRMVKQGFKPRNRPWSEQDMRVLFEFYGKVPMALLAKKLDRTITACSEAHRRNGARFSTMACR